MSINWIEYKGKKILFINAADLMNDPDLLKTDLERLVSLAQKEPKNSILALADLRNTRLNNKTLMALMSNAPRAAPYFCKSALVIEENNARRIILDSFNFIIEHIPKRFGDLETAKEWLVESVER